MFKVKFFEWSLEWLYTRKKNIEVKNCNVRMKTRLWYTGVSTVEELAGSQHVLCAWVSGREAADMELCSDEEVVDSMTRLLRKFTGDPTLPYPTNLLRSKWCMDQYFAGSYSYMAMDSTVGHQCDLASPLPGHKSPNFIIFFHFILLFLHFIILSTSLFWP